MRCELVRYQSGEIALVYPVPAAQLSALDLLVQELIRVWAQLQFRTDLVMGQTDGMQLVDAIAQMLPHHPGLPLLVEPLKEDAELLHSLFFSQNPLGRILQLHRFESIRPKEERRSLEELEDTEITIKDLPFPTSGDIDCDLRANLMSALGVDAADRIWRTTDAESIDKIMYTLEILNKPPNERIQDYLDEKYERLRKKYQEWKAGEGAEILRKRYGIGAFGNGRSQASTPN